MKKFFTFFVAALMSVSMYAKIDWEVDEENATFNLEDWTADGGGWLLQAFKGDSTEWVQICVPGRTSLDGSYTIADCYASMTSFIINGTSYHFTDGGFSVVCPIGGHVILAGDFVCENGNTYAIYMNFSRGEQGIENIELTEQAKKVIVDGVVYIVRDGKVFNLTGTQVK